MKKSTLAASLALGVSLLGAGPAMADVTAGSLFQMQEVSAPVLLACEEPPGQSHSGAGGIEVSESKCGSGACGSKDDHKCGSGSCGSKDDHKCGSGACGSKDDHKCGSGSCGSKE